MHNLMVNDTIEEVDEISMQCTNIINSDGKPSQMLQYLQSMLKFLDLEFVQQLMDKIQDLYNNIRLWILKGHTPSEVFEFEKKHLKPLPASLFLPEKNVSNVIEIKTKTKV